MTCCCENDRFRSIHRHLRFPRKKMVAKLCCLCLLNGNRLSQHGNTSQYEFIWNPRSASLRIIYGSTLRRLQAQFLNAYSTLPSRFAPENWVFIIERIHYDERERFGRNPHTSLNGFARK